EVQRDNGNEPRGRKPTSRGGVDDDEQATDSSGNDSGSAGCSVFERADLRGRARWWGRRWLRRRWRHGRRGGGARRGGGGGGRRGHERRRRRHGSWRRNVGGRRPCGWDVTRA